jgi:hypothetical protein
LVVPTDAKDSTKWRAFFLADNRAVHDIPLLDVPPQIAACIYSATGQVAVGYDARSGRDTLRCWDLNTGKQLGTIQSDKPFSGSRMTISPDGRFVAFLTTDDSMVHICNTATGQERFALRLPYKTSTPRHSRFTADNNYLLTSDDSGGVHVWDMNDGRRVQSRETHRAGLASYPIGGFEFSEDSKYYATLSTDGSTQVWDSATHTEVGSLVTQSGAVLRASFSPSGKRIATAGVGTVRVWDIISGHASTPVMDHGRERVGEVAYSPDGKFLLTTSSGGTVRVWAAPPAIEGSRTPQWIFDLATICAGQRITDDGKIVSSETDYGKIDEIRRIVSNLPAGDSCGEWARWFLSTSPTRSIAPGFIITPADAKKLQDEFRASASSTIGSAP